jgi:hypothetical protein
LPHRIRLRGPWKCDPLTHCLTRSFHRPTGLAALTQVWLVLDDAKASARIELNGRVLGEAAGGRAARFCITADLKPRNLLAITLTAPQPETEKSPHDTIGLVSLEIEEPSA